MIPANRKVLVPRVVAIYNFPDKFSRLSTARDPYLLSLELGSFSNITTRALELFRFPGKLTASPNLYMVGFHSRNLLAGYIRWRGYRSRLLRTFVYLLRRFFCGDFSAPRSYFVEEDAALYLSSPIITAPDFYSVFLLRRQYISPIYGT